VFKGIVEEITASPDGFDIGIDAGEKFHALITRSSLEKLSLEEGMPVWLNFKATAVKFIKE